MDKKKEKKDTPDKIIEKEIKVSKAKKKNKEECYYWYSFC